MTSYCILVLYVFYVAGTLASSGDSSPYYQTCFRKCLIENCTNDISIFKSTSQFKQDWFCKKLQWTCKEECQYKCMFETVDFYKEKKFVLPKFHGKWPFTRVLGIQEPVSAIASLLSLWLHISAIPCLWRLRLGRFNWLRNFWIAFAVVCSNGWFWSTVFHCRDKPFTELMDYVGALSMSVTICVAAAVRMLYHHKVVLPVALMTMMWYFSNHIVYLFGPRIDYSYNMAVNVGFGGSGLLIWLIWGYFEYRKGHNYCIQLISFVALTGACFMFEVTEITPLWYAVDSHAVWHISTVPMPILFYGFVFDDLKRLTKPPLDKGAKMY